MAESGINFMAMLNPQFAAQQQKYALQQQMAQQMIEQGNQEPSSNQLANPGGMVVQNSPWAALSRAVEKGTGAYISNKAIGDQMAAYQNMGSSSGVMGASGDPLMPTQQELMVGQLSPEQGKAMYEARTAGIKKGNEEGSALHITPQGTYQTGNQITGAPSAAPSLPTPNPVATNPVQPADNMGGLPNQQAKPVILQGASDEKPNIPMASDGKPLLPNMDNISAPDPSGTPNFKLSENTKTGVEQKIQDQKDATEGNRAFATTAQNLGQEKSRLDNLISVYKDVQSGTLTAQNPELANKLVALGVITDPSEIKDLAGIQNATQNHILQVIQQIKDTNANAGGGAPTRTFGSEISQLLENGESAKGQPEALWNVIGQAKGLVDHHLDMVNGWVKSGGLGNRLAGGYTMRPDDYAQQFSTTHNISDYRDKALKDMGPFKGMAGNGAPATLPAGVTLQDIQAEIARRSKQ